MTKECSRCKQQLPLEAFAAKAKGPDGRQCWCRSCFSANAKEWLNRSPHKVEQYLEATKDRMRLKYATDPAYRDKKKRSSRAYREGLTAEERSAFYRRSYLWTHYRMTEADFEERRARQNNRCAVCRKKVTHWLVDHCHRTGHVRGLVCRKCNNALGSFNDSLDLLRKAVAYVEGYSKHEPLNRNRMERRVKRRPRI